MRMTDNGHVISSGIKEYPESSLNDSRFYGVMKARIDEAIYIDDARNTSFQKWGIKAVQYNCTIVGSTMEGTKVSNILDACALGGLYNWSEVVRSPAEEESKSKSKITDYGLTNGDFVLIMFLYGNMKSGGIIVGGFPHPQNKKRGSNKTQARRAIFEFNGVEFNVDKNGNLRIRQVGKKDPKGNITNQPAVGSEICMYNNGDIEVNTHEGTAETITPGSSKNLRIKLTKADKKLEIFANNNAMTLDSSGYKLIDKNSNEVSTQSGKIFNKTSGVFQADCDTAKIGANAQMHATLAESVITYNDAHQHLAPQAPAGIIPTMAPMIPMGAYAGTVLDPTALKIMLKGNS